MNNKLLKTKLNEAESRLALAEEDLEAAMDALQPTPRAQKTIAGQVLEEAFAKLRSTRAEVKRLANLVDGGELDVNQIVEDAPTLDAPPQGQPAEGHPPDN